MKKVKIYNLEIPVVIDNRALVDYKREKGHNRYDDLESLLLITWYGLRSGARISKVEFKMTFEEFIDYSSEHPEWNTFDEPAEATEDDKKKQSTT